MAVIALAVGIGSATAIFIVANTVLLKPVPYTFPDRWLTLFGGSTLSTEAQKINGFSLDQLRKFQEATRSFDVFGWYFLPGDFNLTSPGEPQHLNGVEITPWLIEQVGVQPVLGHAFHDSDGPQVALISARLWKHMGGDPRIIGKPLTVNGKAYTVTGVMPGWFQLPFVSVSSTDPHNDLWIPISPDRAKDHSSGLYVAYARLKPGITMAQAHADAGRVSNEIVKEGLAGSTYTIKVFSLKSFVSREIRPVLALFFCAAGLLLLVTCANVAGLLVARSVGRAHEVAVRVALGIRRSQLALQFFLEGCIISIAAAILGVLASIELTRLAVSLASEYIPRSDEIAIDARVLVVVAALAFLTALLPSLAPLWQALRTQPIEVLSSGVRASANTRSRRLSRALIVAEVALAFLLLTVGGSLISEFVKLRHTWPGFDPDHVVTFQLNAEGAVFPSTAEFAAYQRRLLSSLEAIPGVTSAAFANQLPMAGCCFETGILPDGQSPRPEFSQPLSFMIVTPGYFKTLHIPLQRGRLLNENDHRNNPVPIVIDEALARQHWPGRDPIGASGRMGDGGERVQVIGVVGNVLNEGLSQEPTPEFYFLAGKEAIVSEMQFVVRSSLPAATLVPAIREAMQRADRSHPIYAVRTMEQIAQESVISHRFASIVVTFFAVAALLMAVLGIYSVTTYSVRERTVEIGTRMALGAVGSDVLRLVLGGALRLSVYGALFGAAASIAATWFVMRFVYLHHASAMPYLFSAGLVGSLTLFTSLFPAWRASLLTPMVAIRNESGSLWASGLRALEHRRVERSQRGAIALTTLFTGFVDASRRASTFTEALAIAVAELRDKVRSQSALLFEKIAGPDPQFVLRAASPEGAVSAPIRGSGFLLNRLKFHSMPLPFAAGDLEAALRWAREERAHYMAEIEQLRQLETSLVVPLRTSDEIIGLLLLGAPFGRKTYRAEEKQFLQACARDLALMIENARLTDRIVEQEKVRRDVALAAEVQEKLLAARTMETGAASVAACFLPARSVGGDCYDFLDFGAAGAGIALADVAGKGVAAALIMAVVQSSLRIIASENQVGPRELVGKINQVLYGSTGSNSYATLFYAHLSQDAGQLRYVNAGHNPPFLLRMNNSDGSGKVHFHLEELAAGGPVIGMLPTASYEEGTVPLRSGDILLAFTDGVTEALNPTDEEFGEERLKEVLRRSAHLPAQGIVAFITGELRNWMAEAPQHDDLTFIVMKVKNR